MIMEHAGLFVLALVTLRGFACRFASSFEHRDRLIPIEVVKDNDLTSIIDIYVYETFSTPNL